jgi:hypothetical protein
MPLGSPPLARACGSLTLCKVTRSTVAGCLQRLSDGEYQAFQAHCGGSAPGPPQPGGAPPGHAVKRSWTCSMPASCTRVSA